MSSLKVTHVIIYCKHLTRLNTVQLNYNFTHAWYPTHDNTRGIPRMITRVISRGIAVIHSLKYNFHVKYIHANVVYSRDTFHESTKTFPSLRGLYRFHAYCSYGINRLGKRLRNAKQKRKLLKNARQKRSTTQELYPLLHYSSTMLG